MSSNLYFAQKLLKKVKKEHARDCWERQKLPRCCRAPSGIGLTPVQKKFAVLNWKSLIADEPKAVSFWLTVIHW